MPRDVITIEATFEYQVKRILREAMDGAELDRCTAEAKADWLWKNKAEVGKAFMDRVESWMGLEEAITKTEE